MINRTGPFAICLATLCAFSPAAWAADAAWNLGAERAPTSISSPAAVRVQQVHLNIDALRAAPAELDLPLFGHLLRAHGGFLEQHAPERYTWRGTLDAKGEYQVQISVNEGYASGIVSTADAFYELIPSADGTLLAQIDHSRYPECGGAQEGVEFNAADSMPRPRSDDLPAPVTRDAGDDIAILLMYSAAARDAAGGVAQITAQAQAAADTANLSFANSAMRMRFTVVGIELLPDWVEGVGSASTQLGSFRGNATAQARRNALNADLVSLLVAELPSACGIGYVMRNTNVSFAPNGYQITDRDCAVGNLSWAHEHGHNVGFEHDPANGTSPANASRPWSFGHFVDTGVRYRTVMSYACPAGGCTRRPYFSNPRIIFENAPTGIEQQRDNARTGDAVADTVANFRMVDFSFRNSFE